MRQKSASEVLLAKLLSDEPTKNRLDSKNKERESLAIRKFMEQEAL